MKTGLELLLKSSIRKRVSPLTHEQSVDLGKQMRLLEAIVPKLGLEVER